MLALLLLMPLLRAEERVWCLITDGGERVAMSDVLCLAAADDDSTFAVVLTDGSTIAGVRRAHFDIEIPTGLTKPGIINGRDVLHLTNAPAGSTVSIYSIDCRITADIDMTGYDFPGIGTNDLPFSGEIDGQKNIISGLIISRPRETGVGLVNVGTDDMELHDLTLASSCTFTGYHYVGGFVGKVTGSKGGHAYFRNLGFEGTVNVNDNGGGIIGCVPQNDFTAHLTCCYTVGTINGVSDNGALSGWSSYARIVNCYALVKGKGWESGHDICRGFTPHFTNCYAHGAAQTGTGLSTFTQTDMQDGTLLSWLGSNAFRQNVGIDAHPILSHPVLPEGAPEDQPDGITTTDGKWPDDTRFDLGGRRLPDSRMRQDIIIRGGRKYMNGGTSTNVTPAGF
ncbi:MAG: hypothetical protein IJ219_10125 [Bacteroidaceae bacterium]|nr:hypothetical protein [Bacteroidaceae bacterium]